MFIQHGRKDHIVPYQQSLEFVSRAKEIIKDKDLIKYEIIKNADHADLKFEEEDNLEKLYNFIHKCLF